MSDVDGDADAKFILDHAERLVNVATMCMISCGLADGINEALKVKPTGDADWYQAAAGFRDATTLIAALRATLLLDRDESKVSFQGIYRRLKSEPVKAALKEMLSKSYGDDELFPPSRDELIADFMSVYGEIDWPAHGRLTHFRNLGIAHLTIERMSQSVTVSELKKFVVIIGKLAVILQRLCHTPTATGDWKQQEYREIARKTLLAAAPAEAQDDMK